MGQRSPRSVKRVQELIVESPVLKYYDPKADTELQCDASDQGLGACLMQDGQPVCYASRAMTSAETNYAHIEKELLAIVFGLYGSNSMTGNTSHGRNRPQAPLKYLQEELNYNQRLKVATTHDVASPEVWPYTVTYVNLWLITAVIHTNLAVEKLNLK